MLDQLQVVFLVVSAIALFLYGLENFSRELQELGREQFRTHLAKLTSSRWRGFGLGAIFTAIVQSSSAASAIAVSLVHSGQMSFRASLAVLIGANLGTTLTALMVAMKLTGIGPIFLSLGFLISIFAKRYRPIGRVIFYFGFIFFGLDLIGTALSPLQQNSQILDLLRESHSPIISLLIGIVVTLILQSSSVTTGLIVVMVQQGALHLDTASFMILGANIGTTSTALMASISKSVDAKRAAYGNILYNLVAVTLFLPFVIPLQHWLQVNVESIDQVAALIHFCFNVISSIVFLIFIRQFEWLVLRVSRALGS